MSDQAIEREIQAKGKTAPRITPADIEANIAEEHYFTAANGVRGAAIEDGIDDGSTKPLDLLTFCVLILRNGTKIVGINYGPVSPENFDSDMGCREARAHAIDQVWPLMGYELRTRIASHPATYSPESRPSPNCVFHYCPDEAECRKRGCTMGF